MNDLEREAERAAAEIGMGQGKIAGVSQGGNGSRSHPTRTA